MKQRWQEGRQDWQRLQADPRGFLKQEWQETREVISLTLDVIPVVGDVKGIVEAAVGSDLAGNELSQTMRTVMLAASIVGIFTIADEALAELWMVIFGNSALKRKTGAVIINWEAVRGSGQSHRR